MKIKKEEIKLSLFTDYTIIYAENPKNLSKLNEYRKVTGYRAIYKSQPLPYIQTIKNFNFSFFKKQYHLQ